MSLKIRLLTICLFFSFVLMSHYSYAQNFETSLVFGLNASQIDGDLHGGFNKLGITGGAKTKFLLNETWSMGVELLFSQRGSQAELVSGSGFQPKIHLNYIEIPVYASYGLLYKEEHGSNALNFHGGLSYGRLLNVTVSDDSQYNSLLEGFKDNDISYLFGASYFPNQKIGVTVRFSRAFTYLFKDPRPGLDVDALQGYFLSFRAEYKI